MLLCGVSIHGVTEDEDQMRTIYHIWLQRNVIVHEGRIWTGAD